MHEKTIRTTVAFRGKLLGLEQLDIELEDGRPGYREIVRHPGAIGVLARHPDGTFLFVRQYRKAVERLMLEVVAGLLDPGEAPEAAARRELEEETGHRATKLDWLGTVFPSPGILDEKVEIYVAELDPAPVARRLDHDERLDVVAMTPVEVSAAVRGGAIQDAKTLATWALWLESGAGAR